MNKLTYKDFNIGQELVCVKNQVDDYNGDERLTIGSIYKVTDIEFRFPDRICVKLQGPYYFHEEFVPIECFSDREFVRNFKIESLGIKD